MMNLPSVNNSAQIDEQSLIGTHSLNVEYAPCLGLSAVTHVFRYISVTIFPYSITGQVVEYKQALN